MLMCIHIYIRRFVAKFIETGCAVVTHLAQERLFPGALDAKRIRRNWFRTRRLRERRNVIAGFRTPVVSADILERTAC
jgi:hypothetical protein